MPVIIPDAVRSPSITQPTPTYTPVSQPKSTGYVSSPTLGPVREDQTDRVVTPPATQETVVLPSGILYGGEYYDVDVPAGYAISEVTEGTPTVETVETAEGTTTKTTTPLIVSFVGKETANSALESALAKYNAEPKVTYSASGRAGTSTAFPYASFEQQQAARWANYTPEEKVALENYLMQKNVESSLLLAVTVAAPLTFVAAPVSAAIGAGLGVGVQQGVKAVQGGGWLTPEELAIAGGTGAIFSGVGSGLMAGATKVAPILAEKSLSGAVSRIGFSTALGAGGGGLIGGGYAAVYGGDVVEATKTGALWGGAFGLASGVGAEAFSAAKPWLSRRVESLRNTLSPERAMYNRVVMQQQATEIASPTTDLGTKVRGAFSPEEYAMYRRVTGPQTTTTAPVSDVAASVPRATWTQRIGETFRPEGALYRRVTSGTSPKTSGSVASTFSGGSFKPYSSGKGGLMSVVVVKQAPALKSPMKPMPVQLTAWEASLAKETASAVKIEPLTVKAESITKSITAVKTVPKVSAKTEAGTIVGYDPSVWQGVPYVGTRRREKIDAEYTPIVYPEQSPIGHPAKLSDQIETTVSQFERIGQGQGITTVPIAVPKIGTKQYQIPRDILDTKQTIGSLPKIATVPKGLTDVGTTPILDVGTIPFLETTTVPSTVTQQTPIQEQSITPFTRTTSITRGTPRGMFEVSLPEGWGGKPPLSGKGSGRQKRLYPIITGKQFLEGYLSKKGPSKKGKGSMSKRKSKK